MADAKFTPVDHDPFNVQANAPGFIGALAHYIVPGAIGAQMAGVDTANLVKGIAHNVGVYGRALQGENIPLDDLIDASNTVAGLVATGGLGASVPKGALGANILGYSKQDLLRNIEPSLHELSSNIYDTMKKGFNGPDAAYQLAEKASPGGNITLENYLNHTDAHVALHESVKKLASKVSLAGEVSPTTPGEAYAAAIKATGGPPLGSTLSPFTQGIMKYNKQDLLANVSPSLHDAASSIYDHMQKYGSTPTAAAHDIAIKANPSIFSDIYTKHMDASNALYASYNKLMVPPSIPSTTSAEQAAIKAYAEAKANKAVVVPTPSALTPISWQDYVPPDVGTAGSDWLRANPEVANLLFAKQAGFNTSVPLYKGMARPLEGEGFRPASSTSEPALFFATEPDVAAAYSYIPGHMDAQDRWHRNPASILAYARAQNPFQVDWQRMGGAGEYNSYQMNALLEDARARNADLLAIHNISDIAEPNTRLQTQIAVMDPSILRSPWAQFDPARLHEADLLASRGLPLFIPVEHNPFAPQQQGQ